MLGHKRIPSREGGVEVVVEELAVRMVAKGHSVTCLNRSVHHIREKKHNDVVFKEYKGVKIQRVITWDKKGVAAITASITGALKTVFESYDIIHFHAEGPAAMLWLPKLFGKKCIATVHGLDWKREKWKRGIGAKYIKLGEKVLAKYADEVIVLSKGVQQYFEDTYGRKTVLIPNGVNRPLNRDANVILDKYGLQKDSYICALSRLTEEKGIHYLIEAYNQLDTDKKLVIAGDTSDTDDYVAHLKNLAKNNPNIIFTGFVSGELLDEIYSNAYIYVLPSNLEGMPLSLLEAMSYGNAVLGSDISEITDVVEDKAVTFRKSDVEDLKRKLQMMLTDEALVYKLKSEAADYICEKYNWEDVAESTLKLYKGVK